MSVYSERMARVEVEVQELKEAFKEHKDDTAKQFAEVKAQFKETNSKLDELLALRNKGAGVLWLIGGILSAGVIGAVVQVLHFFGVK